jgi:ATP/maltotriose-dependent transcriptional regulator MalT
MARVSSADMLERIERAGLFLEPADAERRWYRYHPLFAQLLRHRLHQEFPDLEPHLRRLADMLAHPAGPQDDDQQGPQPPQDAQTSDPVALDAPLSERERDVLHLLAGGLSNEEIAESLIISANTVKMHIRHIYDKLDVHNRVQAITQAQARAMV